MRIIRPILFSDNAAHITLSQDKVAVVDAADAYLVSDYAWHARSTRSGTYAVTNGYERSVRGSVQMHRLIMSAAPGVLVDHIDGDGLNNRRRNLRLASRAENARNKPAHRNNKLGVKGVHWNERDRRFVALIMHEGKVHRLGSFRWIEDANAAYQKAARELHGAFAWEAA